MNIYKLEVVAIGAYTKINLSDRSGCSDVEVDCWQEAEFTVAAEDLESALGLIHLNYEKLNRDWANSCDTLYYDPESVSVEEDDADGEEILDYHFCVPKDGDGATDAPSRYSIEV